MGSNELFLGGSFLRTYTAPFGDKVAELLESMPSGTRPLRNPQAGPTGCWKNNSIGFILDVLNLSLPLCVNISLFPSLPTPVWTFGGGFMGTLKPSLEWHEKMVELYVGVQSCSISPHLFLVAGFWWSVCANPPGCHDQFWFVGLGRYGLGGQLFVDKSACRHATNI